NKMIDLTIIWLLVYNKWLKSHFPFNYIYFISIIEYLIEVTFGEDGYMTKIKVNRLYIIFYHNMIRPKGAMSQMAIHRIHIHLIYCFWCYGSDDTTLSRILQHIQDQ
ncbi:hypothetical protein ACJX0J_025511, partial [Zea mays]